MEHTSPRHVYYSKFHKVSLIICSLEFFLALPFLLSKNLMFSGFILLITSAFMYSLSALRIVVSPTGISYHNMGLYSIYSTWDNIDRVGLIDFRKFGAQRCIILKKGQKLGWWTNLAWAISREQRGYLIPVSDWKNWEKSEELIAEIKMYIPSIELP
jgi:hypothetical protein